MSEGEQVAEEVETPTSLTIYDVARLADAWIHSGSGSLVTSIDLSRVESIDASGVQLLLHLQSSHTANGQPFVLKNPSEEVMKTFSLLNVDRLLAKNINVDSAEVNKSSDEAQGSES